MYDVEDVKSCICEWFSKATTCVEVAKTYKEIMVETEKQLDFMMPERMKESE